MENNRIDLCAPEGETPIYDQIRQELAGRIRAGSLPDGTRLPTVRELSEQLHVAEGTVKRAYDELERDGLLIKTPGRGSFVCYHRTADRRQAAQEQIDALLQQLHQMGISVHEMKQLFADQLRRFCAQQLKRYCLPYGPKVGTVSVSPRGDLRMPSDASCALWQAELDRIHQRLLQGGADTFD